MSGDLNRCSCGHTAWYHLASGCARTDCSCVEPCGEAAVAAEPVQTPQRPGPATGSAPIVLAEYQAMWCSDCGSRYYEDRVCCRRPLVPITVTITRRDAS